MFSSLDVRVTRGKVKENQIIVSQRYVCKYSDAWVKFPKLLSSYHMNFARNLHIININD